MPTRDEPWPAGTPAWVDCQVDDVEAAGRFYSDLFGWTVQDTGQEGGGYLIALKDGRAAAGIGGKPEGQAGATPSAWTTYFAAGDVDGVHRRVAAAGGESLVTPFDVLGQGRMMVASDPTGAVFAVWQAGEHPGAGVYNEHGSYCWNELHTRDYDRAKRFYADVFGWTYSEMGDGVSMLYSTFTVPGGEASCGGVNDDTKMAGEGPAYWLTWFQVDDVDAATARAGDLGSSVMMGPDATPFGRMSVVRGAQGELFGLIDPTQTTGEMPMPAE